MAELSSTLTAAQAKRVLTLVGGGFTASAEDQAIKRLLEASQTVELPPPPSPGIVLALTADKTGVTVQSAPAGTAKVHWAVMKDLNATGVSYPGESPFPLTGVYRSPVAGSPVIAAVAKDANGVTLGNWSPRIATTPAVAPPPPPPPSSGARTGLVLNSDTTSGPTLTAVDLGARVARAEFVIGGGTTALTTLVAALGKHACRVQPLAGFESRIPSAGEAKGLAAWASVLPEGSVIEFGNETNYPNQLGASKALGEAYGHRAAEAAEACAGHGVGLIVQMSDAGSNSTGWIDGIFAAVPDLLNRGVVGATIHPYFGAATIDLPDAWGIPMLERMLKSLAGHGDTTLPVYATEWGCPSDNGNPVGSSGVRRTYQQAAAIIAGHPAKLQTAAKGRMAQLLYYQAHDQNVTGAGTNKEWYFGALLSNGAPKGAVTPAVAAFLKG